MSSVIVVAHPDDEVIWAGGLALRLKCQIICCTIPRRDPIRAYKFFDCVKELGCEGKLIPITEPDVNTSPDFSYLNLEEFDHIITHGERGEYGHMHHKFLHKFIVKNYSHKNLSFFGYPSGAITLELDDGEYLQKLSALQKYNHDNGIDGEPKWSALIKRYNLNLREESYDGYPISGLRSVPA